MMDICENILRKIIRGEGGMGADYIELRDDYVVIDTCSARLTPAEAAVMEQLINEGKD